MPAIITGNHLIDGLDNLVVHLKGVSDVNRIAWGFKAVYDYPAYVVGGVTAPYIAVEPSQASPTIVQGGGGAMIEWAHALPYMIWVFSDDNKPRNAYRDVYRKLSQIYNYLLENTSPNGFGRVVSSDVGAFPRITRLVTVENEGGGRHYGGAITVTIVHYAQQPIV
jgi:hypothetical protein